MSKDNFEKFDSKKISKYKRIPKRTKSYYKKEVKSGKKPLRFHFIPHIFYKSSLNIKEAEIIEA